MELDQLRYAVEVARAKSFTRAAKIVHVQQPAISRGVKALEDALGIRIFERSRRSVVPTREGREVLIRAEELLRLAKELRESTERDRAELHGPFHFGCVSAVAAGILPLATSLFLARHPRVWPMGFTAPSTSMLEPIDRGDLELGLVLHVSRLPRELSQSVFASVPFRLVVLADKKKDRATLRRFIGSREVEDSATRAYPTLTRLRKKIPDAAIRVSSNDVGAHLAMVRLGVGVSVLPELLVADDLQSGVLADVFGDKRLSFPLLLLTRRGRVLSRTAGEYLECVREVVSK